MHHLLQRLGLVSLVALNLATGCGAEADPATPAEIAASFGEGTTRYVQESVKFIDQPLDFQGDTSIDDVLNGLIPNASVWYGMSADSPFPQADNCDARGNEVETVAELPTYIEGIVTLQPRYFQKVSFCGSDERFYGSYFLQDQSNGILVLKESRVEDFNMGDRVRLRVRGLMKYFDTKAILVSDEQEIVERDYGVPYQTINRPLEVGDVGRVGRVVGKVAGVPTNTNFNEMCLVGLDDTSPEACAKVCKSNNDCLSETCVFATQSAQTGVCEREGGYWLVSLDREIGQRQPRIIKAGDKLEVTGPVVNSFGLKLLVLRFGQLKFLD
ncbi:MAG: hypothetical protein R3E66_18870 [bacterium]